jgi:predicted GTPase
MKNILPAMGYSEAQRDSLAETINACCAAENVTCIVDASPARLDRMLKLDVPMARVIYRFRQIDGPPLEDMVRKLL